MGRTKLQRFREMKSMLNVFEPDNPYHSRGWPEVAMAGKWRSEVFKNEGGLVVELGCGRGDYVMALSGRSADMNFIGVDVKGARLWAGAKEALERGLSHVAFLRMKIEALSNQFNEGEVDEIWITFADPFPEKPRANRRLTSPRFLEIYKKILAPGGRIHLKHDNEVFFDYSLEMFKENGFELVEEVRDLYAKEGMDSLLTEIQTTYEQRHLKEGRKIYYAKVLCL